MQPDNPSPDELSLHEQNSTSESDTPSASTPWTPNVVVPSGTVPSSSDLSDLLEGSPEGSHEPSPFGAPSSPPGTDVSADAAEPSPFARPTQPFPPAQSESDVQPAPESPLPSHAPLGVPDHSLHSPFMPPSGQSSPVGTFRPAAPAPVPPAASPGPLGLGSTGSTGQAAPALPGAAAPLPVQPKPKHREWKLIVAVIVLAVLILGGGYVFAFYLPSTPSNVYKAGLTRTSEGYDKLVSYLSAEQAKHYKGYDASGTVKVTSPDGSGDGTFTSQGNADNATGTMSLDLSGEKFTANYRAVEPKGQDEPDIYFQVNGIKPLLDSFGLNSLDSLDGQWIAVDHTLLETALANQSSNSSSGDSSAQSQKISPMTYAQIQDALQKISPVDKKYLFTTNKKYAVLVNKKFLGKSKENGQTVDAYQVGYDKTNLKAYLNALGTALDGSSLDAWFKQTTGKTITDGLNMKDVLKNVDKAKADYTFTMYVNTRTKLVQRVHFPSGNNPANNYVEVALAYDGGSKYPFSLVGYDKEGGTTTNVQMQLTLDTSNNQITVSVAATEKGDATMTMQVDGTFKPSNQPVSVTAPSNAKPIMNVLASLGLDGSLFGSDSAATSSSGTGSVPPAGVQAKANDAVRETDLQALQSHLEVAYATNGSYPTLAQLNDSSWRNANMQGLDSAALEDPDGSSSSLVASPTADAYAYQVATGGQSYTLTAILSDGQPYVLQSLSADATTT